MHGGVALHAAAGHTAERRSGMDPMGGSTSPEHANLANGEVAGGGVFR